MGSCLSSSRPSTISSRYPPNTAQRTHNPYFDIVSLDNEEGHGGSEAKDSLLMGMSLPEEDQTKWWESDECEDDGASEKMIDAEEDELDNYEGYKRINLPQSTAQYTHTPEDIREYEGDGQPPFAGMVKVWSTAEKGRWMWPLGAKIPEGFGEDWKRWKETRGYDKL